MPAAASLRTLRSARAGSATRGQTAPPGKEATTAGVPPVRGRRPAARRSSSVTGRR